MADKKSTSSKSPYRRKWRNIFIEPKSQFRLAGVFSAVTLAFYFVLLVLNYIYYESYLDIIGRYVDLDERLGGILYQVRSDLIYLELARIFVFCLLVVVVGAVITHRFYGPLVQIRRYLKSLTGGDYSERLKIRKYDEFHDIVKLLNELGTELQKRHGGTRTTKKTSA